MLTRAMLAAVAAAATASADAAGSMVLMSVSRGNAAWNASAAFCRRLRARKAASMPASSSSCSVAIRSGLAPLRSSSHILAVQVVSQYTPSFAK